MDAIVKYRIYGSAGKQLEPLMAGFSGLIPWDLDVFDERELDL